jgi:lipopolysaccharide transport system ATP-binding protein
MLRALAGRPQAVSMPREEEFWALKDVSFEIQEGDVVGILGRNGAGKSTLLKILAQITTPTEGRARVRGRIGSILEIGTGFNPALTGRQNIFLSAAILGMRESEVRRRLDEIIDFASIDRFIDVPVRYYSSGMYARLAFAVVAHLEHEILLIDEVLAVGDAAFQQKCLGKLHGEATSGRTVLFVSHSMPSISSLCNRAILLSEGRVVLDGKTGEVVSTYLEKRGQLHAESTWASPAVAPGNDGLRLAGVRLRGGDGIVKARHMNSEGFTIEIDYWSLRGGAKVGATIAVMNSAGLCIFGSLSNQDTVWHGRPRAPGLYRSNCRIPANLMKDGFYSLTVLLWADNYTDQCRIDTAAEFEVVDSGTLRGDYFGGWEGFVHPSLDWSTDHLGGLD